MSCATTDYELCIKQFASFKLNLTFQDATGSYLDISSWQISGSIKEKYKSPTSTIDFSVETISLPSASINLNLSPSQTALLIKPLYVYDVIAHVSSSSPPETIRLLEGQVTVDPGVTVES
jgi:hypothetical protein